jgi:hypothetical protein
MKSLIHIPASRQSAAKALRRSLTADFGTMPKPEFIRAWSSIFYLYPGLNPEGHEDPESGWPRPLRRFADEAWRRAGEGELADDEIFASDAQWCGIYDRIKVPIPEETQRRTELASKYGELPL